MRAHRARYGLRTDARRRLHLRQIRIDEHTGDDTAVRKPADNGLQACLLAANIQTALRGDFLAALGHQHGHLRLQGTGDGYHFVRGRHFQVELDVGQLAQAAHVVVLDMTPVFAQMHRDAVGTAQVRLHSRPYRVRLIGSACLAQGRHMVDIDAEFDGIDAHSSCNSMKIRREFRDRPPR